MKISEFYSDIKISLPQIFTLAVVTLLMWSLCSIPKTWAEEDQQTAQTEKAEIKELKPDRWEEIRKAAGTCFSGGDATIELNAGLERREYAYDNPSTAPFAGLMIRIPLFSSKEKRNLLRKKGEFIEHLSDLAEEIELSERLLKIKYEEGNVLKGTLLQEGAAGAEKFFKIREAVEKLITKIKSSKEKFEGWIRECGKK